MNTEIKLQDVLHLYLGCECDVTLIDEGYHFPHPIKLDATLLGDGRNLLIKPLLRPLSSATLDEKNQARYLIRLDRWGAQTVESMGEVTRFLLSKHFDLFDLIKNNLAFDKTQQTQSL